MNKRTTSLLLCLVMVLTMLAVAVPAFAAGGTCVYTIEADKATASPGDTVSFTVSMQQTGLQNTLEGTLTIPAGLTYVPDSAEVDANAASALKWTKAMEGVAWTEESMMFNGFGAVSFDGTQKVTLLKFQCTVDSDAAPKDYEVTLTKLVADDEDYMPKELSVVPAKVTVAAKPVAVSGVSLDKSTLTLNAGASETLTAIFDPAGATNKAVTWSSSNASVATVADGTVTAVKEGIAIITVKTEDGNKTATCTVTVNCAHANTTDHAAVASTCKVQGNVAYTTCDDCDKVVSGSSEKLPLADHSYGTKSAEVPATHTAAGTKAYYECSVCGKYFADTNAASEITDLVIPAKGHDTVTAWTSDADNHWHECSCGEKFDKAAHTWGWVITKAATEEAAGLKHEECGVCGAKRSENTEIPKLDHTHSFTHVDAVPSTCTVQGTVDHYHCTKCNKNYADNTGSVELASVSAPLAAHEFTVLQNDDSQHWHKCANCDTTDTKENHNFDGVYEKDADNHWDTCTVCDFVGAAVPHNYMDDEDMNCDACGYDRSHICKNPTAVAEFPATEDAEGTKAHYKCECGKLYLDDTCSVEVEEADLVIPKLPKMIEGMDGKWKKGTTEGLTFVSDADFAELAEVKVDDAAIESANYTAAEGSTAVTLKPEYLETLALGQHKITIVSENGSANANFTVEAADEPGDDQPGDDEPGDDVPQTGDTGNIFLWLAVLFAAGIGIAGTAVFGKKRTHQK